MRGERVKQVKSGANMAVIYLLGMVVGVSLIIYFALKGLHISIAAPLAALVIVVSNQMPLFDSLLGEDPSYMAGLGQFIVNNFSIFLLGGLLGQLMDQSQAAVSISEGVFALIGSKHPYRVLLAIAFITSLLSYGGISTFIIVFTLFPMVRPLFKSMNINWSLVYIPFYLGGCTFVGSMLPGSPALKNILPSRTLNTPLTAGADLGLLATLTSVTFGLIYMKWALKRSLDRGENYYSYQTGQSFEARPVDVDASTSQAAERPPLPLAVFPIMTLVSLLVIFRQVDHIIVIALSVAIVLAALIFHSYIPSTQQALNQGGQQAVGSIFGVASSIAFGTVLVASPAFKLWMDWLLDLPLPPLLSLSLLTSSLSAMMGTGIGPVGIVMEYFIHPYLQMGYSPEVLHRLIPIAAGIFSCMPHTGMVISTNHFSGLSYRNGFIHAFIIVNGCHVVGLLTVLFASPLLY